MSSILIFIYGVIQGLAEFLPISSSGHLAILPSIIDFKDPGVVFDLLMHLGTAIAILVYFHKEVKILFVEAFLIFKNRSFKDSWFFINFTSATVFSVLFILLLKDLSEQIGRTIDLIAINLIVFGILMWLSDLRMKREDIKMNRGNSFKKAILIGISQAFAIFPGVSRSGITLTAARFLKLTREEASRFSFLMSLPIIFASIIYKTPEILKGKATYVSLGDTFLGITISFVIGILTIHFFLKFIKKIGLLPFAIYRVLLGVVLLYFF